MKWTDHCDTCGEKIINSRLCIHSLQMTPSGKGYAYKTSYIGEKGVGCDPCEEYVEKELEEGNIEVDYNLNPR